MKLKDKNILITGASSGIGEALAKITSRMGARPILTARRKSRLERIQNEILQTTSFRPEIIPADICKGKDRAKIQAHLKNKNIPLHILVLNAGITAHGLFEKLDMKVIRKTMELNFFASVELTSLLLPFLQKTQGTKLISFVSTPSGLYGIPERSAYSASKAAGQVWMESLRMELKKDSIRTCIFCPGYTQTNLRTSGLAADGSILKEEQAKNSHTPEKAASILVRSIIKEKRIATTNLSGFIVYWLRTLAPALLEKMIIAKTMKKPC